jgi:hypothetical protein
MKTERFVAVPDLKRKIEESIFDAISYFEKRCPYCQGSLYDGNIRQKLEIDHYIPITLGGQHVPWNLLPVCKRCNQKKNNKSPHDFLDSQVRERCEAFLKKVKTQLVDSIQNDIDAAQQAKVFIEDRLKKSKGSEAKNILVELSKIFLMDIQTEDIQIDFSKYSVLEYDQHVVREFVETECKLGENFYISKTKIYRKYKEFCLEENFSLRRREQFFKGLFSLKKNIYNFRPHVGGERKNCVRGIKLKS